MQTFLKMAISLPFDQPGWAMSGAFLRAAAHWPTRGRQPEKTRMTKMYPVRTSAAIIASIALLAGQGWAATEGVSAETGRSDIGTTVSRLDDQIWKIIQHSGGDYWFGSDGRGVYRFDGERLVQFTTSDGLAGDRIRGIQEDREGKIYVETPEGISMFDGRKFTTLMPIKSPANEWGRDPNDLWFGYNANDLYRFDGKSLHELELPRKDLAKAFGVETMGVPFEGNNNSPYAVYGVNRDGGGNIWFGTVTAGAYRYDGKTLLWFGEKELSALPDGRAPGVRSMIQDKDGYFWLSNFRSKYKIRPDLPEGYEKLKGVEMPDDLSDGGPLYFNSGISDSKGNLWVTAYSRGAWKYDGEELTSVDLKGGAENLLLMTVYEDNAGTIWLGTNNDGVYRQTEGIFRKFETE